MKTNLNVVYLEDRLTPALSIGHLDVISGASGKFVVQGWAYDQDYSSKSVDVHVYANGTFVGYALASEYRPDLKANRGYSVVLPDSLYNGNQQSISVYAIDLNGNGNPLLVGSPKVFKNNPTYGYFDSISASGAVSGWAIDPDSPSLSTDIDLYIDNVFISRTSTNKYRPDINSLYSTTGDHGFSVQIPASYLNGSPHTIRLYAPDRQNPNFGNLNSQLVNSGKFYNFGDYTISGQTNSFGPISVSTAGRYAGGIFSITWNGYEFINSYDHGREIGTNTIGSTIANPNPNFSELYNPTEFGSQRDLFSQTSSSKLLNISSRSQSQLSATTQMAHFVPANTPSDIPPYPIAINKVDLSDHVVEKNITIGNYGNGNIIKIITDIYIPLIDSQVDILSDIQFVPMYAFTTSQLTADLLYDKNNPSAGLYPSGYINPTEQDKIVAKSTQNGSHCIAIVSRYISGWSETGNMAVRYSTQGNGVSGSLNEPPYSSFGTVFRALNKPNKIGGNYIFENYVIVGSRSTVLSSLNQLNSLGLI